MHVSRFGVSPDTTEVEGVRKVQELPGLKVPFHSLHSACALTITPGLSLGLITVRVVAVVLQMHVGSAGG